MESINVQGSPNFYKCEPGILKELPELIKDEPFKHGTIIHGKDSWAMAESYMPEFPFSIGTISYDGECTHQEVARIKENVSPITNVLIGVGGGKILDLTKACGEALDLPVILIPTLVSNCAAWTPLSVFYDENGNFIEYTIYKRSTYMVIVDPAMLVHAPVEYLRAGIGDTIAKWYEADVLTRHIKEKPVPLEMALHAAKLCRDILFQEGKNAVHGNEKAQCTTAFTRVAETIIMAGGMVGGFGDGYGRISGAHSIHNGLTKVPGAHKFLHGEKVAYGILVQLALEGKTEQIKQLIPFYKSMRLPLSLKDLDADSPEDIETISYYSTRPSESIHLMGIHDQTQVREAILAVENSLASL
ncbi:iron-containing alcohol dehydrogenase family protein [Halobacillus sp. SY10]|uniref:iron-containing alcohol dehydrogenase family protein n=1 Tax=Halobacillus sp. SY10 TaxID=3381356 RepID=UPI00387953A7